MAQAKPELIIHVGRQRDGLVFELEPLTRRWLQERYPEGQLLQQVFIGFDTTGGLDVLESAVWGQVVSMLTGLGLEALEALGGVRLYEPWSGNELKKVG